VRQGGEPEVIWMDFWEGIEGEGREIAMEVDKKGKQEVMDLKILKDLIEFDYTTAKELSTLR
jgi:hypothetical protein